MPFEGGPSNAKRSLIKLFSKRLEGLTTIDKTVRKERCDDLELSQ